MRQPSIFNTPWNAREITRILVAGRITSPFHYRKNFIIIPNCSWGLGLNHEADILIASKAKYLTEIEIKVSRSDFIQDQFKHKHKNGIGNIKKFYYAMPETLWKRCHDVWRADYAGVITIGELMTDYWGEYNDIQVVVPAKTLKAKPIPESLAIKMGRLAALRYWERY